MTIDYAFLTTALSDGVAHAFEPLHGNALIAGFVLAAGLPRRYLAWVALVILLVQSFNVLALGGLAWATLDGARFNDVLIRRVQISMHLAAGVTAITMGLRLLRSRRTPAAPGETPPPPSQTTWGAFWAAGMAAAACGMLPCLTAAQRLVWAFSLRHAGQGIAAVFLFSAGLAGILTLIAWLTSLARGQIQQTFRHRAGVAQVPTIGALAMMAFGAVVMIAALIAMVRTSA